MKTKTVGSNRKENITIHVAPKVRKEVRELAKKQGRTVSDITEEVWRGFLGLDCEFEYSTSRGPGHTPGLKIERVDGKTRNYREKGWFKVNQPFQPPKSLPPSTV